MSLENSARAQYEISETIMTEMKTKAKYDYIAKPVWTNNQQAHLLTTMAESLRQQSMAKRNNYLARVHPLDQTTIQVRRKSQMGIYCLYVHRGVWDQALKSIQTGRTTRQDVDFWNIDHSQVLQRTQNGMISHTVSTRIPETPLNLGIINKLNQNFLLHKSTHTTSTGFRQKVC
jgi:hypothetical protein